MKNSDLWKPTKFEKFKDGFRASRNLKKVGPGGRFITRYLIAKKIFRITAHRYPLGYCLVAEKVKE